MELWTIRINIELRISIKITLNFIFLTPKENLYTIIKFKLLKVNLKQKLDQHYKTFDKSQLMPDPLQFPHKFSDEKDIEVMAFIASVFAYGNVTQIINSLNKFLLIAKNKPHNFIINFKKSHKKYFIHRFYSEADVQKLLILLQIVYNENGSLKNLFLTGYDRNHENLKNAITHFSNFFLKKSKTEFGVFKQGNKIYVSLAGKGECLQTNEFISPLDGKKR